MKKNLKNIFRGICIGILLTFIVKYSYQKIDDSQKKKEFIDTFDAPNITNDIKFKKKVIEKKYTFNYYGQEINIQDEDLKVYGFDNKGEIKEEKLENVDVIKINNDINFDNYISGDEYQIYKSLQNKDDIDTQYKIFTLFVKMRKLSEELLERGNSKDRIEYLYNNCLLYIEPNSKYTIGHLKFDEINFSIQKDIKEEVSRIKYIIDNSEVKEESTRKKIGDNFNKVLKYELFGIGK